MRELCLLTRVMLLLLLALAASCRANSDFCEDSKLPKPRSEPLPGLHFTKELSRWEYGVLSEFKSLHCCAKGYTSIEWSKDGKAYPWSGDTSGLILYPESANQTIYRPSLGPLDAGNYTCTVRNDSAVVSHTIRLNILERTEYMERPLLTYQPPPICLTVLGTSTRLFCEAFIGQTNLPDAKCDIKWEKKDNSTWKTSKVHRQHVQRDFGRIVGEYLLLEKVDWDDLGVYTCTITSSGGQSVSVTTRLQQLEDSIDPLELKVCTLLFIYVIILIVTSAFIICALRGLLKNRNKFLVLWNKIRQVAVIKLAEKKKVSSVTIFVSKKEMHFAELVLVPALKFRGLNSSVRAVSSGEALVEERIRGGIPERSLVVVSPHLVLPWTAPHLNQFIQAFASVQSCHFLSSQRLPTGWEGDCVVEYGSAEDGASVDTICNALRRPPLNPPKSLTYRLCNSVMPQRAQCSEIYV